MAQNNDKKLESLLNTQEGASALVKEFESHLPNIGPSAYSQTDVVSENSTLMPNFLTFMEDWVFYNFDTGINKGDSVDKLKKLALSTPCHPLAIIDNADLKEILDGTGNGTTILDKMLRYLNKKGTWIETHKTNVKKTVKVSQSAFDSEDELLSLFDKNISSGNLKSFVYEDSTTNQTKAQSIKDKKVIFFDIRLPEKQLDTVKIVVGFPKAAFDVFEDLEDSDIVEPVYKRAISFSDVSDLDANIAKLEKILAYHSDLLSKEDGSGYDATNFNLDVIIQKIKDFSVLLKRTLSELGLKDTNKLTFKFNSQKCDIVAKDCIDPQTTSYMVSAITYVDGKKTFILKDSLAKLDTMAGDLAAYVFYGMRNINKTPYQNFKPRNFLKTYVYSEASFKKRDSLEFPKQVAMKTGDMIVLDNIVGNSINLAKYSNIKKNIQNKNNEIAKKTPETVIREGLRDVQNLKDIYRKILYRFEIQDVMEHLSSCLLNRTGLATTVNFVNKKTDLILNFLEKGFSDSKGYAKAIKVLRCTGFPIQNASGYEILNVAGGAIEGIAFNQMQNEYSSAFADVKSFVKSAMQSKSLTQDESDKVVATLIDCTNTMFEEEITGFLKNHELLKALHDETIQTARTVKRRNPGTRNPATEATGNASNAGANTNTASSAATSETRKPLKQLLVRNLKRRFEQEMSQIIKDFLFKLTKELIQNLLKSLDNSFCKASTLPSLPGDLKMTNTFGSSSNALALESTQTIQSLLTAISDYLSPEDLCGAFNATCGEPVYEQILKLIKTEFVNLLYVDNPIVINGVTIVDDGLYNTSKVKTFILTVGQQFPSNTTTACKNFFDQKNSETLPIDDKSKCIDLSQAYAQQRKESLMSQGYTEQETKKLLESEQVSLQNDLNKLNKLFDSGFYGAIDDAMDGLNIPLSADLKKKIDGQIDSLFNSYETNMKLFSNQIYQLFTKTDGDMLLSMDYVLESGSFNTAGIQTDNPALPFLGQQYSQDSVFPYGTETFKTKYRLPGSNLKVPPLTFDGNDNFKLDAKNSLKFFSINYTAPNNVDKFGVESYSHVTLPEIVEINYDANLANYKTDGFVLDIITLGNNPQDTKEKYTIVNKQLNFTKSSTFVAIFGEIVNASLKPFSSIDSVQYSKFVSTDEIAYQLAMQSAFSSFTENRIDQYFKDLNVKILQFVCDEYQDVPKATKKKLYNQDSTLFLDNTDVKLTTPVDIKQLAKDFLYFDDQLQDLSGVTEPPDEFKPKKA